MKSLIFGLFALAPMAVSAKSIPKNTYKNFCDVWTEAQPQGSLFWQAEAKRQSEFEEAAGNAQKNNRYLVKTSRANKGIDKRRADKSLMGVCVPYDDGVEIIESVCIKKSLSRSPFFGNDKNGRFFTTFKKTEGMDVEMELGIPKPFELLVAGNGTSKAQMKKAIQDLAKTCGEHFIHMDEILPPPAEHSGNMGLCDKIKIFGSPAIESCEVGTQNVQIRFGGDCAGVAELPLKKVTNRLFEVVLPEVPPKYKPTKSEDEFSVRFNTSAQANKMAKFRATLELAALLRKDRDGFSEKAKFHLKKVNKACGFDADPATVLSNESQMGTK